MQLHKKVFHEKKKINKDQKPLSNNIATEEPMVTLTDIDLQEVNFLCDDERYNTVTYLIPEMLKIIICSLGALGDVHLLSCLTEGEGGDLFALPVVNLEHQFS
uniref:Protein kinase domain-containing protein n=1 Tax=Timema douglasi TaxID=61478 RepID=A0A7R8ZB57_TIMDO|nr:unnamed protein product [Timema douglasi]